jgi:hypothetical protein
MASDPDARAAILIAIHQRLAAGPAGLSVRQLALATGRWPATVQAAVKAAAAAGLIERVASDNGEEESGDRLTAHDAAGSLSGKALLSLPLQRWQVADHTVFEADLREIRWRAPGWRILEALRSTDEMATWDEVRAWCRGPRETISAIRRLALGGAIVATEGGLVLVRPTLNLPTPPRLLEMILRAWAEQHNRLGEHLNPAGFIPLDLDEVTQRVRAAEQEWQDAQQRADRVLRELGVPALPPRARKSAVARTRQAA